MSTLNDGGPAFPRDHANLGHNGMTLRDYFAAKALPALILEEAQADGGDAAPYSTHLLRCPDSTSPLFLAEAAYKFADAMLEARKS